MTAADVLHAAGRIRWLGAWGGVHRDGLVISGLLVVALSLPAAIQPSRAWADSGTSQQQTPTSGFEQQIIPVDQVGPYPTDSYDIGYDAGGLTDFSRKILGFLTELFFSLVGWLVDVGVAIVTWAYGFHLANELAQPAASVADAYQSQMIGPLGLSTLALFVAACYGGWQIFRGRLPRGVGEFAVSLLVLALSAFMLADPAGIMTGTFDASAKVSGAILSVTAPAGGTAPQGGSGSSSTDYSAYLTPLVAEVHRAYVEEPYDILDWGQLLDGTSCAAIRNQILATGPHGADDLPRQMMSADPACKQFSDFNHDPSFARLMASFLMFVAAAITLVLLVLVAGTVIVAQIVGVALIAVMPFAVVGGLLPGAGRQLLWRWVTAVIRVFLAIVVMSFLLSFLLVTLDAWLKASQGDALLERFGVLVVVVVLMVVARKRFLRGAHSAAARLGQRLESARVGGVGGPGWLGAAAVGGATGFGLAERAREGQREVRYVTGPASMAMQRLTVARSYRRPSQPGPPAPPASGTAAAATLDADPAPSATDRPHPRQLVSRVSEAAAKTPLGRTVIGTAKAAGRLRGPVSGGSTVGPSVSPGASGAEPPPGGST